MKKINWYNIFQWVLSFFLFIIFFFFQKQTTATSQNAELTKLFPPYITYGRIQYNIDDLKQGQKVEVLCAENRKYYLIKNSKQQKILVPSGSIALEYKNYVAPFDITYNDVADYANSKELESDTDYLIWVDLYRNHTYVLGFNNDKWMILKDMICSSGRPSHPTPRGLYKVLYKTEYIGTDEEYLCKYSACFYKGFMLHSVLYEWNGIDVRDGRLGKRISLGCVRLSVDDSLWIYENVPEDSTIWIN